MMRKTKNFALTYENEFGKQNISPKIVWNFCPSKCEKIFIRKNLITFENTLLICLNLEVMQNMPKRPQSIISM